MARLAAPQSVAAVCWMKGMRRRRPQVSRERAGKRAVSDGRSGGTGGTGEPAWGDSAISVLPLEDRLQGRDQGEEDALRAHPDLGLAVHAVVVAVGFPLGGEARRGEVGTDDD